MNTELKNLAAVVLIGSIIVFLALPNKKLKLKKFNKPESFDVPSVGDVSENEFKNAVESITAVRAAIKDKASKVEIDELKKEILRENKIRIIEKNGLLTATTKTGTEIAKEQKNK